jgi:hypothetical protein
MNAARRPAPDVLSYSAPPVTLHKRLPKAKTPHEQESLKRTIAATDNQIDEMVFELYGLTKQEIRIVEALVPTGKKESHGK